MICSTRSLVTFQANSANSVLRFDKIVLLFLSLSLSFFFALPQRRHLTKSTKNRFLQLYLAAPFSFVSWMKHAPITHWRRASLFFSFSTFSTQFVYFPAWMYINKRDRRAFHSLRRFTSTYFVVPNTFKDEFRSQRWWLRWIIALQCVEQQKKSWKKKLIQHRSHQPCRFRKRLSLALISLANSSPSISLLHHRLRHRRSAIRLQSRLHLVLRILKKIHFRSSLLRTFSRSDLDFTVLLYRNSVFIFFIHSFIQ